MTPCKKLNFYNFITDLIFHPDHALPEDRKTTKIITVALGILTLGAFHLGIAISWGIHKIITSIKNLSAIEKKTDATFKRTVNLSEKTTAIPLTTSIKRKGFENPNGVNCFFASALQCLASVRQFLPSDVSKLNQDKQEIALSILALLDKVLSGKMGTENEVKALKQKLKLEGMGDSREAISILLNVFGMDKGHIYIEDKFIPASFPLQLPEDGSSRLIVKSDTTPKEYTLALPVVNLNQQPLDFLILQRIHLPLDLNHRKSLEIPQIIKLNHQGKISSFELVSTAQSLGGHAIAYTKEANQWVECNDEKISLVDPEEAYKNIQKNSMILVYRPVKE